jgi:hypothetical protein
MTEWYITLAVTGDIAIQRPYDLDLMKGRIHAFMTTVHLEPLPHGVRMAIRSRGRTATTARQSALFFVGEMLNVLGLHLDIPLSVSLADEDITMQPRSVRRLIDPDMWTEHFDLGRRYGQERLIFAQALRWFRKGITSDDPIDRLLALWLSLEVIGSKAGRKQGTSNSVIVKQIVSCCYALWPDQSTWPAGITETWVEEIKNQRNEVAHGEFQIYPERLEDIAAKADRLQTVARHFLLTWEQRAEQDSKVPPLA